MGYLVIKNSSITGKYYITNTCNKPRIAVKNTDNQTSYIPMKTTTSTSSATVSVQSVTATETAGNKILINTITSTVSNFKTTSSSSSSSFRGISTIPEQFRNVVFTGSAVLNNEAAYQNFFAYVATGTDHSKSTSYGTTYKNTTLSQFGSDVSISSYTIGKSTTESAAWAGGTHSSTISNGSYTFVINKDISYSYSYSTISWFSNKITSYVYSNNVTGANIRTTSTATTVPLEIITWV